MGRSVRQRRKQSPTSDVDERMTTLERKIGTADFITRLADKGYTKKDSAIIVGDVLDVFYDAIRHGETVSLNGFGRMTVKFMKAKDIVNIQTGRRETVPAHNVVKFTPGLALKAAAEAAEVDG